MLDPIVKTIEVPCPQKTAYEVFLDMGSWWPLDKRSMSIMRVGSPAKRLVVDATVGGQIHEVAADDSEILWGKFNTLEPHTHIEMDFHMGLPADQTGQVAIKFTPLTANSTQVELTHFNWEGYGDMAEMMIQGYGGSWDLLFVEHFGAACAA